MVFFQAGCEPPPKKRQPGLSLSCRTALLRLFRQKLFLSAIHGSAHYRGEELRCWRSRDGRERLCSSALTVCSDGTNLLWTPLELKKRQMRIDLIFDLLIRVVFVRRNSVVCVVHPQRPTLVFSTPCFTETLSIRHPSLGFLYHTKRTGRRYFF